MNSVQCWRLASVASKPAGVILLLLGGLLLLPAHSALSAPAPAPADFPLALHARWIYHLHQEVGPGVHFGEEMAKLAKGNTLDVKVITEVVGSDAINGEQYVRLESRRNGVLWLTEWDRQAAGALLLGKTIDSEQDQEVLMVPPQKLLSATLKAGETWDWKASDAPVVMHVTVVGSADTTVPAGTFRATQISHVLTIDTGGETVTSRQTRWFAPGVGYVKQDTETKLGNRLLAHVVLTLEKYEPAPGVHAPQE